MIECGPEHGASSTAIAKPPQEVLPQFNLKTCALAVILVLLRRKLRRDSFTDVAAWQHGHRGSAVTSAIVRRRRIVEIEFGTCRSGRMGGASGSITLGNGKFRHDPLAAWS